MKLVPDIEVDLTNDDLLQTKPYVAVLEEICANVPPKVTTTIGLAGAWGSGKSSILKTFEKKAKENAELGFVYYDAWKYVNDSFRRTFLVTVKDELKLEGSSTFNSFYTTATRDSKVRQILSLPYVSIVLSLLLILLLLRGVNLIDPKETIALGAVITLFVSIMSRAFLDLKESVSTPYLFAAEQFENCYKELVQEALTTKKETRTKNAKKSYKKLYIVVDNIDRCSKESAYELLTAIKTFLCDKQEVIFIIPFDEDALLRHIGDSKNGGAKDAAEFVRKLFSVIIRIKPFKSFDLFDYTNEVSKKYQLGLQPTSIDIISREYASNPRKIIQFCNNLAAEMCFLEHRHGKEFAIQYESLICKALIIRDEWPMYYQVIAKNPNILIKEDTSFFDSINEKKKDKEDKGKVSDNSKQTFLRFSAVTTSIEGNLNYEVWDKILSVSDRNALLPTDLMEAVESRDVEEIIKAIENKTVTKESVINALIEQLNTAIKRTLFKTAVIGALEVISEVNEIFQLSSADHLRVRNELSTNYPNFMAYVTKPEIICRYAFATKDIQPDNARDIFWYIRGTLFNNEHKDQHAHAHETLVAYCRLFADKTNQELVSTFIQDTIVNDNALQSYSDGQLQELVSASFLSELIKGIRVISLDDNQFPTVAYLFTHIEFEEELVRELFIKVIESWEQLNEEIEVKFLKGINVLLDKANIGKVLPKDTVEQLLYAINRYLEAIEPTADLKDPASIPYIIRLIKHAYVFSEYKLNIWPLLINFYRHGSDFEIAVIDFLNEFALSSSEAADDSIQFLTNEQQIRASKGWLSATQFLLLQKDNNEYLVIPERIFPALYTMLTGDICTGDSADTNSFWQRLLEDARITNTIDSILLQLEKDRLSTFSTPLFKYALSLYYNNPARVDFFKLYRKFAFEANSPQIEVMAQLFIENIVHVDSENSCNALTYLNAATIEQLLEIKKSVEKQQRGRYTETLLKIVGYMLTVKDDDSKERLLIHSARYGAKHQFIDVKDVLIRRIKEEQLHTKANNQLGPDPIVGTPKLLTVDYSYNGLKRRAKVKENDYITLPE
ncbi:MAG: hypothetical protein J0I41_19675 [Filimonas sp.]|nr:hypothetical protein [Filimonas sp.]